MIHYICDRCQCRIEAEKEVRYVVRIEIQAAVEASDSDNQRQDQLDQIEQLEDILEILNPEEIVELENSAYQKCKYDLCQTCYQRYQQNPLAIDSVSTAVDFSNN